MYLLNDVWQYILYHNFHVGESSVINLESSVCYINNVNEENQAQFDITIEFFFSIFEDFVFVHTSIGGSYINLQELKIIS